jgi:SAM-dependent methyltransferase
MTEKELSFICPITGDYVQKTYRFEEINREGVCHLDLNSRSRSIVILLLNKLLEEISPLKTVKMKHLKCIGMSDNPILANYFANSFDYQNTFFDVDPKFDIYEPEGHIGKYDFVISSDVFEHISPYPGLDIAFKNLYNILKPNGFVVFSVPFIYTDCSVEHFPNLFDYKIVTEGNKIIMHNKTIDGKNEKFENLIFHGGPGVTLEMRLFCKSDLEKKFLKAGFKKIHFLDPTEPNVLKYGIFWGSHGSNGLTMLIEK